MIGKITAAVGSLLLMICIFTGCSGSAAPSAQTDISIAESYIGSDVRELIAEIGEPRSAEYQASCELPEAEDGFLTYDGFTVVTVKTAEAEIVQRVDADS